MTCVWDGLIQALTDEDLIPYKLIRSSLTPIIFYKFMKNQNKIIDTILWNDQVMSSKEQKDCYDWINDYKESFTYHCMASTDPFLILYSYLFHFNITNHVHNGYTHSTVHTYTNTDNPIKIINFRSDIGHFSYIGSISIRYSSKSSKVSLEGLPSSKGKSPLFRIIKKSGRFRTITYKRK